MSEQFTDRRQIDGKQLFFNATTKAHATDFMSLMAGFPDVDFYFPNHDKSPWHVQAKFGFTVVNFYPHKVKMYGDGLKATNFKMWAEANAQLVEWQDNPETDFEVLDDG